MVVGTECEVLGAGQDSCSRGRKRLCEPHVLGPGPTALGTMFSICFLLPSCSETCIGQRLSSGHFTEGEASSEAGLHAQGLAARNLEDLGFQPRGV